MDPRDLSAISEDDLDISDQDQLDELLRRALASQRPVAGPDPTAVQPDPYQGQVDSIVAAIQGQLGPLRDLQLAQPSFPPAAGAGPQPTDEELQEMMLGQGQWPATGARRATKTALR